MRLVADFVALLLIAAAQWHLANQSIRWARSKSSALGFAATAFWTFAIGWLAVAFLVAARVFFDSGELSLPIRSILIGGAYLWAFSTTGAWIFYRIAIWLSSRIGSSFDRQPMSLERRRWLETASACIAATPAAMAGYGFFVERTNFRVQEVDIPIANLPSGLNGLRILQLSDIHLGSFLEESELARVVDASNELRPDLAVITGDLISVAGDPLEACIKQLGRVRTIAGIYGCLGNHERYARAERETVKLARAADIRFLRREATTLKFGGDEMRIAGVDHQTIRSRGGYLRGAETLIQEGAFNVLLSHNPDVFPVAKKKGFDLTLAGHTHGGQVAVEILDQNLSVARFFTPFVHGVYREGQSAIYVTRGIGTIGLPARIGAPPEISVIRLVKEA